jgi:hypothetical protein
VDNLTAGLMSVHFLPAGLQIPDLFARMSAL